MRQIETDYLVVGGGASGMAFVDSLIEQSDADVVMVDRRHRPGGHWLDAYPFVRLHQPSAVYGVNSSVLGHDRIDETGPNAGFYERATAAEICDYYARVLDETLIPSGQVRFFGMTEYRGSDRDGHRMTSLLNGEETTIRVRRKVVDATYVESSIPSRHAPPFTVDAGVRMVPPNHLVNLDTPAAGFTVFGAGKTAMDTCNWLLDSGVDPDVIQWFRPRDPWMFDRAAFQPLERVGSYLELQAAWVAASAEAEDATDFAHRLESDDVFMRLDPEVEPSTFRGAILSAKELGGLRTISRVVPQRRVVHLGAHRIITDQGEIEPDPNRVHVDCTAAGVRRTIPRPVFESDRITLQYVTIGIIPWGAATLGFLEARIDDDAEKNRLSPPVVFTGEAADLLHLGYAGISGLVARSGDPDVNAWTEGSRLNPARGAADHLDDPRVSTAFASLGSNLGAAIDNLERLTRTAPTAAV